MHKKTRPIFPIVLISAFLLLVITVVIVTLLSDNQADDPNNEGNQDSVIDDYIYIAQSGFIHLETGNAEMISGLALHGELIYYIYTEYMDNPDGQNNTETSESIMTLIQIKGIDKEGNIEESITIPSALPHFNIIGFDINNAGEFLIVTHEFDSEDTQDTLNFLKYSKTGNPLLRAELSRTDTRWFPGRAYFDKNGTVAVVGRNSQHSDTVLFWDDNQTFIREELLSSTLFTFTTEGTFLHHANEQTTALQENDYMTGDRVQEHPISTPYIISMHIAENNSRFDYYAVTEQHLYGYIIGTGETEPILDFSESLINLSSRHYIAIHNDGSIVFSQARPVLEGQPWIVELALLSPVHRTAIIERDYILLAGFRLRQSFVNEVQEYNRRNPDHQIVIHDYWDINDDTGFRQAIDRLHFELHSGNIPDIILFEGTDDADLLRVRESLAKQGMLSDLYPFIDADPVLSREDFFPNVLRGYEDTEGNLFAIGNWLSITTMVTTNPSLQINDWTVRTFLDLMEQSIAAGNPEPLGSTMTDITFLTIMLEHIGNDFIDYKTGICNFESDSFIRLLELAAKIPPNPEFRGWGVNWRPDFDALHNGSQVVDLIGFAGLPNWTSASGNSLTTEVFNYIGLPSSSGGVHSVQIHGTLSIFADSQYPDEAWQFIREELFPGATWEGALTLRKDDFENRLSASNLTSPEKNAINVIMNQAVVYRPLSGTILMIVEEDFSAFSRGNRTAAETARIIQNRVQTYLHERS